MATIRQLLVDTKVSDILEGSKPESLPLLCFKEHDTVGAVLKQFAAAGLTSALVLRSSAASDNSSDDACRYFSTVLMRDVLGFVDLSNIMQNLVRGAPFRSGSRASQPAAYFFTRASLDGRKRTVYRPLRRNVPADECLLVLLSCSCAQGRDTSATACMPTGFYLASVLPATARLSANTLGVHVCLVDCLSHACSDGGLAELPRPCRPHHTVFSPTTLFQRQLSRQNGDGAPTTGALVQARSRARWLSTSPTPLRRWPPSSARCRYHPSCSTSAPPSTARCATTGRSRARTPPLWPPSSVSASSSAAPAAA